MSNPTIFEHSVITPFLGNNRFKTFVIPDAQIPTGGLAAGYCLGVEPNSDPLASAAAADAVDAVIVLAQPVADGADRTALCCVMGDVRADSLTFPAGQTLDGDRGATYLTHRESLRRAGIFCRDYNARLATYDVGTATE